MNPDEFEQQLRQRSIRPIPTEWRTEILSAAKAAASPTQPATCPVQSSVGARNTPSFINPAYVVLKLWQELIWPCRRIWLGMSAIWLVVLAWNVSMDDAPKIAASQMPPPTPEVMAVLREQRQLLVQLLDPVASAAIPPAAAPRPRSERRETIVRV